MNFFILEDNEIQSLSLQNILKKKYEACQISACHNIVEAMEAMNRRSFDILLIDIEIEDENSIDAYERIIESCPELSKKIIYLTAHRKYAMDALNRTHCFGYIEKPYDEKKLTDVIDACLYHGKRIDKDISFFDFKIKGENHFVNREHILYVEFSNKKPILYTQSEIFYLPRTTINQLMDRLNADGRNFIRCRRDNIVNLQQIAHVKKQNSLNYVVLNNGASVPIGDKYKEELYLRLRI